MITSLILLLCTKSELQIRLPIHCKKEEHRTADLDWAAELARRAKSLNDRALVSPPRTGANDLLPRAIRSTSADPTAYRFEGNRIIVMSGEELDNRYKSRQQRFEQTIAARTMARELNLTAAKATLNPILAQNDQDQLARSVLAEVLLFERDFNGALSTLYPFLTDTREEQTLLMAAYAGAMLGEAVPGQKEYCDEVVRRASGGNVNGRSLTTEAASQGLIVSSTLALASWYLTHNFDESAKHYFLRAQELKADEAWAAYSLGKIFARQRNWPQAARYFEIAAEHGTGDIQKYAKREYQRNRARTGSTS